MDFQWRGIGFSGFAIFISSGSNHILPSGEHDNDDTPESDEVLDNR